MTVTIDCPFCKTHLRLPENAAGRMIRCPRCGTAVRVPEAEDVTPGGRPRPGPPNKR
jgi:hypothetical protein